MVEIHTFTAVMYNYGLGYYCGMNFFIQMLEKLCNCNTVCLFTWSLEENKQLGLQATLSTH
jgi:hypothetical protein